MPNLEMSCLITGIVDSEQDDNCLANAYSDLLQTGWKFYITTNRGGTCNWVKKTITLPFWLWNGFHMRAMLNSTLSDTNIELYRIWYLAHEMSHALDAMERGESDHSPAFMRVLKSVCPSSAIGYEGGYQTETAIACGIIGNLEGF